MIVEMAKVRIVGPKTVLMPVLDFLQGEGLVHFESRPGEVKRSNHFPLVRKLTVEQLTSQARDQLDLLLERVRRILLVLPPLEGEVPTGGGMVPVDLQPETLKKTGEGLESLSNRIDKLVSKRKTYLDDLSLLKRYQKVLKVLYPMIKRVRKSRDLEYTGLVIHDHERIVIRNLEAALKKLTGRSYELFYEEVDADTLAALLVLPKEEMSRVRGVLLEENIGRLRLPPSITEKPLAEGIRIIIRKQKELPGRIARIERELEELSRRWFFRLEVFRRWLEDNIGQILVSSSFYETKKTFLIFGWIPLNRFSSLGSRLEDRFNRTVVLEKLDVARSELVKTPVTLKNYSWVRPYQIFTRLLPLPRYGTVDPTPFIAVFFPLFFGMIVGDIGYGLVIILLSYLVQRRFPVHPFICEITRVFRIAGLSAILWGIAFGELFGNLGERLGIHPLLFNRMEDFISTLYLALGLGLIHILLGIGLGIYTALRQGERRELISKLSGLVLLIGFIGIIGGSSMVFPEWTVSIGAVLVLLGLPALILGGGISGVMELHNLVNVMSYLRLMGIGVASVALAFAANTLGGLTGNLLLGILVGGLLHLINIVFAIFSPAIQSLRLHYVEFFENFFKGGGTEYRPFKRST